MFDVGRAEILILIPTVIIPFACFWRIFGKAGLNRWWSAVCLLPPGGLVLLVVLALTRWPALPTAKER